MKPCGTCDRCVFVKTVVRPEPRHGIPFTTDCRIPTNLILRFDPADFTPPPAA